MKKKKSQKAKKKKPGAKAPEAEETSSIPGGGAVQDAAASTANIKVCAAPRIRRQRHLLAHFLFEEYQLVYALVTLCVKQFFLCIAGVASGWTGLVEFQL